jgi:hypothetical protein
VTTCTPTKSDGDSPICLVENDKGPFGKQKSRGIPLFFLGRAPTRILAPGHTFLAFGSPTTRGRATPILEFSSGELSPPLDSCRCDPVSLALAGVEETRPPPRPLRQALSLLYHPRRSRSRSRHRRPWPRSLRRRPRSGATIAVAVPRLPPLQSGSTTSPPWLRPLHSRSTIGPHLLGFVSSPLSSSHTLA